MACDSIVSSLYTWLNVCQRRLCWASLSDHEAWVISHWSSDRKIWSCISAAVQLIIRAVQTHRRFDLLFLPKPIRLCTFDHKCFSHSIVLVVYSLWSFFTCKVRWILDGPCSCIKFQLTGPRTIRILITMAIWETMMFRMQVQIALHLMSTCDSL